MDITDQIATHYGTTPFNVLTQDAEHVIMVINYLLEKSQSEPVKTKPVERTISNKNDGFWDF